MGNSPTSGIDKLGALHSLRNQWLLFTVLAGLSTLAGGAALGGFWSSGNTIRWALIAGLVLAYQLVFTRRRLATNHRVGEVDLLPNFGLGTILTMLRGVLIAWTAGFLLSPRPISPFAWAPAMLYTTAIILDQFDGYAARARNQTTKLCGELDTELDPLG